MTRSMQYYENVLELIGKTPMVKLNKMVDDSMATVLVKMEQLNPGRVGQRSHGCPHGQKGY